MDPHPIIVHFPVALLTIYALFECLRFKKVVEQPYWFFIKGAFVILGALGAAAAYLTGPEHDHGVRLIEMHEKFATASLIIFAIIGLGYVGEWFMPNKFSKFILQTYVIVPLAIIGLVAIVITGGLGGAIVYGANFDPFMAPVFKFLGV